MQISSDMAAHEKTGNPTDNFVGKRISAIYKKKFVYKTEEKVGNAQMAYFAQKEEEKKSVTTYHIMTSRFVPSGKHEGKELGFIRPVTTKHDYFPSHAQKLEPHAWHTI